MIRISIPAMQNFETKCVTSFHRGQILPAAVLGCHDPVRNDRLSRIETAIRADYCVVVNHVCIRAFLDNEERLRQLNSRAQEVCPGHRKQRSENSQMVQGAISNSLGVASRSLWQFNLPIY